MVLKPSVDTLASLVSVPWSHYSISSHTHTIHCPASAFNHADNHHLLLHQISKTSGVLSLSVWLFAQLPQIIENHINQSVAGVSPLFLGCWIAGDITNLVGCILTRALPFQTCLAAYYCFIDCILTLQFWYYTRVYPKQKVHHNLLQSPNMLRPTIPKHPSIERQNRFQDTSRSPIAISNPHEPSLFQKILSGSFISGSFKTANGLSVKTLPTTSSTKSLSASVVLSAVSAADIGRCSAWLCSFLYLASRSPQIVKNHTSKSTKGISVYLFLFAMMGNLFYTISIVSDLWMLCPSPETPANDFHQLLQAQLPFIVGSLGTVLFDTIILIQCWLYQPTHKEVHNVSESPLCFQKPDWYTNNFDPRTPCSGDSRGASRERLGSPLTESSSLLHSYSIPPPSHYISASNSHAAHPQGLLSNTFASLARSLSQKDLGTKSPTASIRSSRFDRVSTSPIPTNLIPSIVGNYSSVSRKMSNEVKIPFSPQDFLNDDFYHNNHSHNHKPN